MRRLERLELSQLISHRDALDGPCISIYVPFQREQTRRSAWRLTQRARELLERHYPEKTRTFLEHLETFAASRDSRLRNDGSTGVALFKSQRFEGFVPLTEPPPELAVVADSFHVRPLLSILQAQHTYYVLVLGRQEVKVFEGGPRSLDEVAEFRHTAAFDDITPKATRDLLRGVDKSLATTMARPDAPVVLFGPLELQTLFREINGGRNRFLGGFSYGEAMPTNCLELHARAWGLARAMMKRDTHQALAAYDEARRQGFGSDSLATISKAAAAGRVKTLFLEKGVHLWGRVCRTSGALKLETGMHREPVDDILDDLAEMTLAAKGQVYVIPTQDMPTSSTLCAIIRPYRATSGHPPVLIEDVATRR